MTTTTVAPPKNDPASNAFAYVLAAILFASLVWAGGLWNLLANSRVLDLLMRSGVIAFTDAEQGFYNGVPDAEYFVASQDPIDWMMLLVTGLLLVATQALRSLAFASTSPIKRDAARAFFLGSARGAFRAYDTTGRTGVYRVAQLLTLVLFTFIGLVALAWTTALGQLVWPAAILGVAYFLVRPPRGSDEPRPFDGLRDAATSLARRPATLFRTLVLAGLAFFVEVVAVYALSQAFSSTHVILNIDLPVVLMAVVAAHLATLVRITPGGFGQFEWGMAAALYIGGLGIPESVTLPLLYAVLRYAIAAVISGVARVREA